MWTYGKVKVHWLGHDTFVLQGSKTVVIDPFRAEGDYKADLLLVTHEHSDHLSEDDIRRFTDDHTVAVAPRVCESGLSKFSFRKRFVSPGSTDEVEGVRVSTIPAYNIDKFREPGKVFHPRADGRVGYVVTMDGSTFYHAGDSDATPEMMALEVDVAFLPVSGTYVMTAEEAAKAANSMRAKVVVPMHYGSIIGTDMDAEKFRGLVGGLRTVVILEKEG